MLAASINWGAIGAISGVFVLVLTVTGGVARRRQNKQRSKRDRIEAEMTAEHEADAAVLRRLAEHDAEIKLLTTTLKGEDPSWANPHPSPGLVAKVDNIAEVLNGITVTLGRIERNGNGH